MRLFGLFTLVLIPLVLTPLAQAQSCYSSSYQAAPTTQYTVGDDSGQSYYSQSYAAPTTSSCAPGSTCYGQACIAAQSQSRMVMSAPTGYTMVRSAPPRYETTISANAIHFPPPPDRLVSTSPLPGAPSYRVVPPAYRQPVPPSYQPARPRGRVRTVMVSPTYNQVVSAPQVRQPLFGGLFRGSSGGGCPGGVCR